MPGTILIVEDDAALAATLEIALLQVSDFEIVLLRDGRQAVHFLEEASLAPSAVFTDLDLPRLDGYELIRWMRARTALFQVPVIAMSARNDGPGALAAGANRFLGKPYPVAAVRELLKELLNA